jgi:hypothetical protein
VRFHFRTPNPCGIHDALYSYVLILYEICKCRVRKFPIWTLHKSKFSACVCMHAIQVKRCPGSHPIQGGSFLQFHRLRRFCIRAQPNFQRLKNLPKLSKSGKRKGTYDREPSMGRGGHQIDLESPQFPTSDSPSYPTTQKQPLAD